MKKISGKVVFAVMLFTFYQNAIAQNLDTNSIILVVNTTLYLDFNKQNVPSDEELKCLIISGDSPFELQFQENTGFKNFVFVSAKFSMESQNKIHNNCNYRINSVDQEYVLAFDTEHKKAYKIKGFSSNDFAYLYQDYVYLNSEDFPKKNKKKFFKRNYSIDGVEIKELLK